MSLHRPPSPQGPPGASHDHASAVPDDGTSAVPDDGTSAASPAPSADTGGADRPADPHEPAAGAAEPAITAGRLAGATRWALAGRLVTQLTRFGVSILLARLLDPEAFALVAVAMTAILALEVLRDLGTGSAVIQRREVDDQLLTTVFVLNVAIGAVLTAAMALGAGAIAALFGTSEATPVVQALSAVVIVQSIAQTHHALLRRDLRFRSVATVDMASALVTAAVSIGMAVTGFGVWAMVWGNIAGVVVGGITAWSASGWRPRGGVAPRRLGDIAHYSLNTTAFNVVRFVLREADKVLVGRVLGVGALGIYSLGQRTVRYPVESIGQVLMSVLFPAFARIQDDDAALRRGYTRATGAIALVVLPVMIGVAVCADPIVDVVLGEKWRAIVPLLQCMAPAGAIAAVTAAVDTIFSAKGRADHLFRVGFLRASVTLAGVVVGLRWGLPGLAIGYLVAMVVQSPIGMHLALRSIGMRLRDLVVSLLPYVAMVAVMAAAVLAVLATVPLADGPLLALGVLVGVVVYGGLALWWRPPAVRDLVLLVRHREQD